MKRFSEREGFAKPRPPLRPNEMTDELRNSLWNLLLDWGLDPRGNGSIREAILYDQTIRRIAADFFKVRSDSIPGYVSGQHEWVLERYVTFDAIGVYDFVEYRAPAATGVADPFRTQANQIFERELAPVRFVGSTLTLITREAEVEAIETAVELGRERAPGVAEHLETAMRCLRARPEPDIRNSIKESISAVEVAARLASGSSAGTLGDALATLRKTGRVPEVMAKGFDKLYGWTNGPEGIRHGLMDEPTAGLVEAQYMLVSCSAFSSYLLQKSSKAPGGS